MKAVGFWPNNQGGGIFLNNRTFHLKCHVSTEGDIWPIELEHNDDAFTLEEFDRQYYEYGLNYHQAIRNGWQVKARCDEKHIVGIMQKNQANCTLCRFSRYNKSAYGKPPRYATGFWEWYNIHHYQGETLGGHEWEWADLDGDRVVWTEGAKLFAMEIGEEGRGDIAQLADFSNWNLQMVQAPY